VVTKKWLPMHCSRILTLFILLFFVGSLQAQKAAKKFIKKYDDMAIEKMRQYGIPASIILGVSMEESNSGQSPICKNLHNFFGIKGKNTSSLKKMGFKSNYKEYPSDSASFEHFCQVIKKKSFYKKLKGTVDYKEWLKKMNIASYSTSKQKWIDRITATIEKYKLQKFDKPNGEAIANK
jgi:flagellum-specific peptidoglycan hydrolase FlgJ